VLLHPVHVRQGLVDIVEKYLSETSAPTSMRVDKVGEPAVVRPKAGQALRIVPWARCWSDHLPAGKERGDGVREDDLGDDAVGVLLCDAPVVVPVPAATVILEVPERVAVLRAPGIEVVVPCRRQVLAVGGVVRAGVAVGTDHRVAVAHQLSLV
jgi:hypothetical protein